MITTILVFLWMFSNINNNLVDAYRLPLHRQSIDFRMPNGVFMQRLQHPRISKSEGLMRKFFKTGRVSVMQKPVVIRVEKPRKRMRAIVISENTVHV